MEAFTNGASSVCVIHLSGGRSAKRLVTSRCLACLQTVRNLDVLSPSNLLSKCCVEWTLGWTENRKGVLTCHLLVWIVRLLKVL